MQNRHILYSSWQSSIICALVGSIVIQKKCVQYILHLFIRSIVLKLYFHRRYFINMKLSGTLAAGLENAAELIELWVKRSYPYFFWILMPW